jgi:hypothetical protein
MSIAEPAANVGTEDILNLIIPEGRYARILATANDAERFFRRTPRGWTSISGTPTERFEDFTGTFGNRECSFSPIPWMATAVGTPAPLHALFVRLRVGLNSPQLHHPAPGVNPVSEAAIRARILDPGLLPSLVIAEGDAFVGFWILTTPLSDASHARRLLLRIAGRLGGDRSMVDLDAATVRIVGTRNSSVYPSRTVNVETWAPDRTYPALRIEEWLSWTSA